jgi:hypothetical protein
MNQLFGINIVSEDVNGFFRFHLDQSYVEDVDDHKKQYCTGKNLEAEAGYSFANFKSKRRVSKVHDIGHSDSK